MQMYNFFFEFGCCEYIYLATNYTNLHEGFF